MERIDPGTVFGSERSDKVDFEIAFTAFVVTVVLSFPVNDLGYTVLKALVISLSGLTLLRKMAVSNQHGPSEPVLRWTMPFIQAITLVATVHIFLEAGAYLAAKLPLSLSPVVAAAPLIPLFVLGVFGFHEKVTKDASLYIALLSHNASKRAEDAEIFGLTEELDDWYLDKAGLFVAFSNSTAIPSELSWLKHRVDSEASPQLLGVFAVGIAGYALIWLLVSWVFGASVLNLVFLFFIFFVKYPIQFWYSRFGLGRFTSDRSGWFDALIILLGLLAANLTILPRYG
ncbi:hypothetical protein [Haloarcula sp. 1CSR25-25]|jgi:hypothetical protein|uniref:hypothetical protein n=1 Tax=Haloarcula sp. 1CSR25-25 TaxID=2862545 RepID=UPI0028941362|nr:hypothetical protein [Haloarcula sp. 1CSR25-25]MDT3437949.1 hypothetical protein [Haloarcula sp. 1CSR25-25]